MVDQQRRQWEKDDLSKPRIFTIAGFPSIPDNLLEKKELIKDIELLRGIYLDTEIWDSRVTHVITYNQDMTEKVMAAIAAGRWVVSVKFVKESKANGDWLDSPRLFVSHDAVLHNRKNWFSKGVKGGLFYGMRAALMLDDTVKNGVYKRVIEAGGGTIARVTTLSLYREVKNGDVTHVFIDPWITKVTNSRNRIFEKFRNHVSEFDPDVKFLWYKYLYSRIKEVPGPPLERFGIFDKRVQKAAKTDEKIQSERKRKNRQSFESQPKKKKTDLIILESSDEEESFVIENIQEESDDDIEILEQRLENKHNIHGNFRIYLEKNTTKLKQDIIDITEDKVDDIIVLSDSDEDLNKVEKQLDTQNDDEGNKVPLCTLSSITHIQNIDLVNSESQNREETRLKENKKDSCYETSNI